MSDLMKPLSPAERRRAATHASPQWRGRKFANPLPMAPFGYTGMLAKWARGVKHTAPAEPIPVVRLTTRDFASPPTSGLRITWLGHSSSLIEIGGQRVLLDPVFSDRASPVGFAGPKRFHAPPLSLDELPAIDAVVISHNHFDHLDRGVVRALGDRVPRYVVPLGVGAHLEPWGVAADRIVERDWWQSVQLGTLTMTATPARHFSGRGLADRDKTLWCGWVVASDQHRVYFSGDTAMFPEFAAIGERLGPFDAVLMESGAYDENWADVHIGPEQAIEARLALGSGLFIPVHWGTFNLAMHAWTEPVERVLAAAARVGVAVAVPRPGQAIEPAAPPPLVRWWPELPWQTADEAPVVSSGLVPAT